MCVIQALAVIRLSLYNCLVVLLINILNPIPSWAICGPYSHSLR